MDAIKVDKIEQIIPMIDNYDVIAIDEGQFFPDVTILIKAK